MKAIYIDTTSAYQNGYADAMGDMRRRQQEKKRRRWYFSKQRLYGIALIAITVLAVMTLDGDATIAVFTVSLGLYLIFSKEMLIVNNFYWQEERRKK